MAVLVHRHPNQVALDPLETHQHSPFNFETETAYNPYMNLVLIDVP